MSSMRSLKPVPSGIAALKAMNISLMTSTTSVAAGSNASPNASLRLLPSDDRFSICWLNLTDASIASSPSTMPISCALARSASMPSLPLASRGASPAASSPNMMLARAARSWSDLRFLKVSADSTSIWSADLKLPDESFTDMPRCLNTLATSEPGSSTSFSLLFISLKESVSRSTSTPDC